MQHLAHPTQPCWRNCATLGCSSECPHAGLTTPGYAQQKHYKRIVQSRQADGSTHPVTVASGAGVHRRADVGFDGVGRQRVAAARLALWRFQRLQQVDGLDLRGIGRGERLAQQGSGMLHYDTVARPEAASVWLPPQALARCPVQTPPSAQADAACWRTASLHAFPPCPLHLPPNFPLTCSS